MQSPLPSRLLEHSGLMMLCACPHVLVELCCTMCAWWEQVHVYKYNAATYVDVYQAALKRRRKPKHLCLQIVLIITLYISQISSIKSCRCAQCPHLGQTICWCIMKYTLPNCNRLYSQHYKLFQVVLN